MGSCSPEYCSAHEKRIRVPYSISGVSVANALLCNNQLLSQIASTSVTMARRPDAEVIYAAVDQWREQCLVGNGSVFLAGAKLWTIENIQTLGAAFTGKPQLGSDDFLTKLQQQLLNQHPAVAQLAAEMLWVLFLFPRKLLSPDRKRELVTTVWNWAGYTRLLDHGYLREPVLAGVGSAGTAFNTQRDRELNALLDIVVEIKRNPDVLRSPWVLAGKIGAMQTASRRNIRNILLHLLYPTIFERIASLKHKREIVTAFSDLIGPTTHHQSQSAVRIDHFLGEIRSVLEMESPGRDIDFYDPDIQARWAKPKAAAAKIPRPAKPLDGPPASPTASSPAPATTAPKHAHDGPALSEAAAMGVWEANRLARAALLREPETDLLLAAYLLLSGHPRYGSHSAMALYQAIARIMLARQPSDDPGVDFILRRYGLPALPVFDGVPPSAPGPRLQRVLATAEAIAAAVSGGKPYVVSTRHVLAALIRPGPDSVAAILEQYKLEPHQLRTVVFSSIASRHREEDEDAWQRILLRPEASIQAEKPNVYAGFSTDSLSTGKVTQEDDRLDVMTDVTALCEVLAAHDTRPPLAVGLFGDWGTGKSFFMELMKAEIDRLGTQNPSFYCSRVVQVWFNAWHYMDTNLWASLASRVFEALAEQLEQWKEPEGRRQSLFAKLQESRGVLAEAVEQKADATARLASIRIERDEKKKTFAGTGRIAFQAAVATLSADQEIQKKLRDAKDQLGLSDAQVQLENAEAQAREFKSLAMRLAAAFRALGREPMFLLVGVLIFATVTGLAWWALDHWELFSSAGEILAKLTTAVAGLLLGMAPIRGRVSRAVHWLEDVNTRLQQQLTVHRREEEMVIQRDLVRLDEREREAQAQVDALTRDITEMRAGRRLERFIMERHTSAEYRQQLGIVSLIRNDFHQLSNLLSESARERMEAAANPSAESAGLQGAETPAEPVSTDGKQAGRELPRIDRIILYIDDLDRCPEDRVVDVLQAVHLLLAFPLFVVVVGVDSRWLLLSLKDHYAALRGRRGGSDESEPEWNTTPQNYLEKIFQIPFTLRPMASGGFGSLVDALLPLGGTSKPAVPDESQSATASLGGEVENGDNDGEDDFDDADAAWVENQAEAGSNRATAPIPPNPEGLTVEEWEREFIRKLNPLIASPRALKRFTNVYRFIRVQQRGPALNRFCGTKEQPGEFQVLALLLAALVGHPAEATTLLRYAITAPGAPWWELVDRLKSAEANGTVADEHAPRHDSEHERPSLRHAMLEVKRTVPIAAHPPEAYARWARHVARFSFQSGRILSMREPGDPVRTTESTAAP